MLQAKIDIFAAELFFFARAAALNFLLFSLPCFFRRRGE